ncbi:unnamed protein product [Linum trigynum]
MTEMRRSSSRRRLLLAEVGGRSSLGFGEEKRKRKPRLAAGGDRLNQTEEKGQGRRGLLNGELNRGGRGSSGRGWREGKRRLLEAAARGAAGGDDTGWGRLLGEGLRLRGKREGGSLV